MAGSRIPAALRARIGDDATFGLIELLDTERNNWSEQVLSVASDRFERRLTDEISTLRDEMRNTLNEGLTSVRQELATTRVETLKWSFVFWVGQVAAMAGLLAFMLRHP
jgi:CHASE3 domain sensor protein